MSPIELYSSYNNVLKINNEQLLNIFIFDLILYKKYYKNSNNNKTKYYYYNYKNMNIYLYNITIYNFYNFYIIKIINIIIIFIIFIISLIFYINICIIQLTKYI